MAHSGVFENPFDKYSTETAKTVLNVDNNSISADFAKSLEGYKTIKLDKLLAILPSDIDSGNCVYTGAAGVGLLYYKYATRKIQPAHHLLLKCIDYLPLDKLKDTRIAFLHGDAGPLAIASVVSYKLGSRRPDYVPKYKNIVKRLTELSSLLEESPDELLYGRSGYLYALLFVNKHIGKEVVPSDDIEKVVQKILRSGKELSLEINSESPLMWKWHGKVYIGAAHGIAGILYMLLQARAYISAKELRELVRPTLDWVLGLRYPSGNFPSSVGSTNGDRLVQWCHGAPGFVPLCLLAHQVFEDDKYMKAALECGELVWRRGLSSKGFSLCHGVGGNAYAFIQLYQATKKPEQLYRACCFTEWCTLERPGTQMLKPDRPASLFEGLAGQLCLIEDILHIDKASFPAYSLD